MKIITFCSSFQALEEKVNRIENNYRELTKKITLLEAGNSNLNDRIAEKEDCINEQDIKITENLNRVKQLESDLQEAITLQAAPRVTNNLECEDAVKRLELESVKN